MKKKKTIEELKSEGLVTDGNGFRSNFRMEMPKDSYFTQEKPIMEFLKDKIKNKNTIEDLVEEGLVTTAKKIAPTLRFKIEDFNVKGWVQQIEDYCSSVGILPEDLIKTHREANKGFKSKTKTLQQGIQEIEAIKPIGGKKDHYNWNEDYKKRKLYGNE